MKKIETWPASYRIRCLHSGMGRPYADPGDVYEIEPGDLKRYQPTAIDPKGAKGSIYVECPQCGQQHFLSLVPGADLETVERAFDMQQARGG